MNTRNRSNFSARAAQGPGPARTAPRPDRAPAPRERDRIDEEPFAREERAAPPMQAGETRTTSAGTSLSLSGEMQPVQTAAILQAVLQAQFTMAKQFPRNMQDVERELLEHCKVPEFAEKAVYAKPIGVDSFVFGPTIRFAEVATAAMGNIFTDVWTTFDSRGAGKTIGQRTLQCATIDLQKNHYLGGALTFDKTIERYDVRKGVPVISDRPGTPDRNGNPRTLYLLHASDDEVRARHFAMTSILVRNWTLRHVPRALFERALRVIEETEAKQIKGDPSAALRRVIADFLKLGITAEQLRRYLGHDLGRLDEKELMQLRWMGAAIKEGRTSWGQILAAERDAAREQQAEESAANREQVQAPNREASRGDEVAANLARRRAQARQPTPAPRPGNATGAPVHD